MKMNEILENIKMLACSQGFYGRLYNAIIELKENDENAYNDFKAKLEEKNFKDTLDLVMYFEC